MHSPLWWKDGAMLMSMSDHHQLLKHPAEANKEDDIDDYGQYDDNKPAQNAFYPLLTEGFCEEIHCVEACHPKHWYRGNGEQDCHKEFVVKRIETISADETAHHQTHNSHSFKCIHLLMMFCKSGKPVYDIRCAVPACPTDKFYI